MPFVAAKEDKPAASRGYKTRYDILIYADLPKMTSPAI
jgi:hypothetical protein